MCIRDRGKDEDTEGLIKSLKTRKNDRRKIIIQQINNLYTGSSGSPVINENGLMIGTVYGKDSFKKKILDLLKNVKDDETLFRVRRMIENIRRVSEYASDIGEVVLNMNVEKLINTK